MNKAQPFQIEFLPKSSPFLHENPIFSTRNRARWRARIDLLYSQLDVASILRGKDETRLLQ
uniref:Putative ovule protein n=1 Tax=Solanum chacoense TaxID=4108 RepID=A0A0V0IGT4_SOLCH